MYITGTYQTVKATGVVKQAEDAVVRITTASYICVRDTSGTRINLEGCAKCYTYTPIRVCLLSSTRPKISCASTGVVNRSRSFSNGSNRCCRSISFTYNGINRLRCRCSPSPRSGSSRTRSGKNCSNYSGRWESRKMLPSCRRRV